jgi:hypothetical protein
LLPEGVGASNAPSEQKFFARFFLKKRRLLPSASRNISRLIISPEDRLSRDIAEWTA